MAIPRSAFLPDVDPEWKDSYRRPKWMEELRIDGNVVTLTRAEANSVDEYSASFPTARYQGKVFKTRFGSKEHGTRWGFRWYEEVPAVNGKRMLKLHSLPMIVLENH